MQFAQFLGFAVEDRRFDSIRASLSKRVAAKKAKRYDPHPMQPVYEDTRGTIRFRKNVVVEALLDWDSERGRVHPNFPARSDGGLNWIGTQDFAQEDEEQLAQLIGYSVSGYHELPYVSDKSAAQASELVHVILDAGCRIHGTPSSAGGKKRS